MRYDRYTYPTICDRTNGASRKSKPQSDRLLVQLILIAPSEPSVMGLDFLSYGSQSCLERSEFLQRISRECTFRRSQRFDSLETCRLKIRSKSVYRMGLCHCGLLCIGQHRQGLWVRSLV